MAIPDAKGLNPAMGTASGIRAEVSRGTENGSLSTTETGREPAKPSSQNIPGVTTAEVRQRRCITRRSTSAISFSSGIKATGCHSVTVATAKEHVVANDPPAQKRFEASFGERRGLVCAKNSLNEKFLSDNL